jgi:hypothetical protein
MSDRDEKPKFPRRRWRPGQQERVEQPREGKGSYDRSREREETEREVNEALEETPPPDEEGKEGEEGGGPA